MDAYDFLPQFSKMLSNLSTLLEKGKTFADQRKYESEKLLTWSLAPDQFNLTRQVQIACDSAKYYAHRLTGKDVPKHDDKETTVPQLQERIRSTIQYLESFRAEDFKDWGKRKTTNPRREGKYLPGTDFAMQHAIPNFYFHMTTAYSILRAAGVEVGKKDYLGDIKWLDL